MSDDTTTPPGSDGAGKDFTRYLPQRSFGLKLILVCGLALLMAIPAGFVWALIYDRSNDAQNAVFEVSQLRGGEQTMMGPFIAIPYERDIVIDDKVQTQRGSVVLYAETGTAVAELSTETLTRGLHDVPVYSAEATYTATFQPARIADAAPANARLEWDEARLYMTVTDPRGARVVEMTLDGQALEPEPVDTVPTVHGSSITYQRLVGARIPWVQDRVDGTLEATANFTVTGAQRISFAAFARDTEISMSGDWAAPSFEGGVLPDDRTVSDDGFTATWRIPYLARGAAGAGADIMVDNLLGLSPAVRLLDEANPYQSIQRALKYAPMFLGLVFLTYFLFETTSGRRAHPAQYILVGLAQLVFYLLLLSVSEVIGFTPGFLVAAVGTVLAISLYAGSVFGSLNAALKALGVFTVLYALIYTLLRLEDYALLAGSIASFLAIAGTMYMTRNLDWYGVGKTEERARA